MVLRWISAPPPIGADRALPPAPPMRRLKLLHVITAFEAGAGGNTLLSAAGMDATRYETWIAGNAEGPLWAQAEAAGIRTVRIDGFVKEIAPREDLAVLRALLRLMRAEHFDIVHVHSAKAGVLGRLAARLCKVPVVVCTIHGRDPWWPASAEEGHRIDDLMPAPQRWLFRRIERALCRITDAFVAVSPTVARDAVLAGIAPPGRISVAPSAVDVPELDRADNGRIRRELGITASAPLVGTVGRIGAQKCPLDFVRMAALVRRSFPDARFAMVGEGELAEQVRRLAAELEVPLVMTGYRPDAALVAATFDVYVVTSRYEGVGRAVTEALASGCPVVATAVDGVVDLVTHGSTGLLVSPRDVDGLASATCWLLEHPDEAAKLGRQGSTLVRELFTPERMCAALDEVYRELLGTAPDAIGAAPDAIGAAPDAIGGVPPVGVRPASALRSHAS
jgi:glycosyltransferase involved in cell wall biosynthesis